MLVKESCMYAPYCIYEGKEIFLSFNDVYLHTMFFIFQIVFFNKRIKCTDWCPDIASSTLIKVLFPMFYKTKKFIAFVTVAIFSDSDELIKNGTTN